MCSLSLPEETERVPVLVLSLNAQLRANTGALSLAPGNPNWKEKASKIELRGAGQAASCNSAEETSPAGTNPEDSRLTLWGDLEQIKLIRQ